MMQWRRLGSTTWHPTETHIRGEGNNKNELLFVKARVANEFVCQTCQVPLSEEYYVVWGPIPRIPVVEYERYCLVHSPFAIEVEGVLEATHLIQQQEEGGEGEEAV